MLSIEEMKTKIREDIKMLEQSLDVLAEETKTINNKSDSAKLLLAIKCNSYTTLLAVLELHLEVLERGLK